LEYQVPLAEALTAALRELSADLPPGSVVGFEDGPLMTPNAYVSTLQLGASVPEIVAGGLQSATLRPASSVLREIDSRKTEAEIELLRQACRLGEVALTAARAVMTPGRYEYEVAAAAIGALAGAADSGLVTGDRGGEAWVMSGPNSAVAYRAFAATGDRRLERGDLVLVHMNPQVRGIWSDLTRTFILGEPNDRQRAFVDAVLEARAEARRLLRPGAVARQVDAAARAVLARQGYGPAFKHQLGHGIGFNGISGLDSPSLHPLSSDVLAAGMCFNIEPSIYIDGYGGVRHCDALALSEDGPEELSPYLASLSELVLPV
jgi:Xaa-Pro aminopeptidase